MVSGPTLLRSPRGAPAAGFSFIELMVIMGILAMLAGLSVGWLQSAGRVNALGMARTQLLDAARRAQARSQGGRLATLTFRRSVDENERPVDEVAVHVAETVLSHAFERLDGASGRLPMEAQGDVKIDPLAGRTGGCAVFGRGGSLAFAPQPSFAVTEGLELEAWILPQGNAPVMALLDGEGCYEIALFRALTGGDYDLRLRVNLKPADGLGEPAWAVYETDGGPVKAHGRWVHVRVAFDGQSPIFEVDSLERAVRATALGGRGAPTPTGASGVPARSITVPPSGAVALRVGTLGQPYQGRLDSLVFRGVFRLKDDVVALPSGVAFEVRSPPRTRLPYRVRYANGRLDALKHPEDVLLVVRDTGRPDDLPLVVELGRSGLVRADMSDAPPPATPATPGSARTPESPAPDGGAPR
jgi:type II secretory pathway pseudopilin PulG